MVRPVLPMRTSVTQSERQAGVIKSVAYCIYSLNTNLNPDSFVRLDFP